MRERDIQRMWAYLVQYIGVAKYSSDKWQENFERFHRSMQSPINDACIKVNNINKILPFVQLIGQKDRLTPHKVRKVKIRDFRSVNQLSSDTQKLDYSSNNEMENMLPENADYSSDQMELKSRLELIDVDETSTSSFSSGGSSRLQQLEVSQEEMQGETQEEMQGETQEPELEAVDPGDVTNSSLESSFGDNQPLSLLQNRSNGQFKTKVKPKRRFTTHTNTWCASIQNDEEKNEGRPKRNDDDVPSEHTKNIDHVPKQRSLSPPGVRTRRQKNTICPITELKNRTPGTVKSVAKRTVRSKSKSKEVPKTIVAYVEMTRLNEFRIIPQAQVKKAHMSPQPIDFSHVASSPTRRPVPQTDHCVDLSLASGQDVVVGNIVSTDLPILNEDISDTVTTFNLDFENSAHDGILDFEDLDQFLGFDYNSNDATPPQLLIDIEDTEPMDGNINITPQNLCGSIKNGDENINTIESLSDLIDNDDAISVATSWDGEEVVLEANNAQLNETKKHNNTVPTNRKDVQNITKKIEPKKPIKEISNTNLSKNSITETQLLAVDNGTTIATISDTIDNFQVDHQIQDENTDLVSKRRSAEFERPMNNSNTKKRKIKSCRTTIASKEKVKNQVDKKGNHPQKSSSSTPGNPFKVTTRVSYGRTSHSEHKLSQKTSNEPINLKVSVGAPVNTQISELRSFRRNKSDQHPPQQGQMRVNKGIKRNMNFIEQKPAKECSNEQESSEAPTEQQQPPPQQQLANAKNGFVNHTSGTCAPRFPIFQEPVALTSKQATSVQFNRPKTLKVTDIFGIQTWEIFEGSIDLFNPQHFFHSVDVVKSYLCPLNNVQIRHKYRFVRRHGILFKHYFTLFARMFSDRKMMHDLLQLVADCGLYTVVTAPHITEIYDILLKAQVKAETALKHIVQHMWNPNNNTNVDSIELRENLLMLLISCDWQNYLPTLAQLFRRFSIPLEVMKTLTQSAVNQNDLLLIRQVWGLLLFNVDVHINRIALTAGIEILLRSDLGLQEYNKIHQINQPQVQQTDPNRQLQLALMQLLSQCQNQQQQFPIQVSQPFNSIQQQQQTHPFYQQQQQPQSLASTSLPLPQQQQPYQQHVIQQQTQPYQQQQQSYQQTQQQHVIQQEQQPYQEKQQQHFVQVQQPYQQQQHVIQQPYQQQQQQHIIDQLRQPNQQLQPVIQVQQQQPYYQGQHVIQQHPYQQPQPNQQQTNQQQAIQQQLYQQEQHVQQQQQSYQQQPNQQQQYDIEQQGQQPYQQRELHPGGQPHSLINNLNRGTKSTDIEQSN